MKVGLYAGSFDPVHLGHVALITTASEKFDRLVVVVAANPQKRTGMFSVPERVQMLEGACRHLGNVLVAAGAGLLIDMAGKVGADALVRSAGKEHVDEKQMAYMNATPFSCGSNYRDRVPIFRPGAAAESESVVIPNVPKPWLALRALEVLTQRSSYDFRDGHALLGGLHRSEVPQFRLYTYRFNFLGPCSERWTASAPRLVPELLWVVAAFGFVG